MCRTFSLPEIKQSDLLSAVKALECPMDSGVAPEASDSCWSDEDLLNLLNDIPDEIGLDSDCAMSEDDSSLGYSSLSEETLSAAGPSTAIFDMGHNFGLRRVEEGFVGLPSAKSFSQIVYKTSEMIREEKLNAINPFIDAMNDGDLFSLFTICNQQCSPDMLFYSQSCGFKFSGIIPMITFWTLLFQKHYQGRIQCLERRITSTVSAQKSLSSGAYENVNLILKLEGCRLSQFHNFDIYQALMNSGYVHDNLSLHELIHLVDAFNLQHQQSMMSAYPSQHHYLYHMTYLFEVNLRFHAINHTISSWNWELIGVESH